MHKEKFVGKVLKTSILISLLILVIFLALIPVDYSLSIGWAAGSFASLLGYSIGILLINKILNGKKSKTLGFWVGWLRFNLILLLQGSLFIALIAIDKSVSGHSLFGAGDISDVYSPINVFTYIGGLSLIFISILVVQFLSRKESENGK